MLVSMPFIRIGIPVVGPPPVCGLHPELPIPLIDIWADPLSATPKPISLLFEV